MSGAIRFEVLASEPEGKARAGRLETPHGAVDTPAFMAVGTQATVKTLGPADLSAVGSQIILANAYHLSLRPGAERISRLGGLHEFMRWSGPLLTDSGGYQLFSLAPLAKVTDEGIAFQSHLDGTRMNLTPERAVEIQEALGPDIAMVLDEPLGFPHTRDEAAEALHRTTAWAMRSKRAHRREDQALFGIVQGEPSRICERKAPGNWWNWTWTATPWGGFPWGRESARRTRCWMRQRTISRSISRAM